MNFGSNRLDLIGNPYALARIALYDAFKFYASEISKPLKILDVGCGSMPYRALFSSDAIYHGLEIDQPRNRGNPNVHYFYDGRTFPCTDKSYDLVLCSQVLEHTFDPELILAEMYRILKPRGSLLLSVPFFWPEHEKPYDSQRLTSFGLIDRVKRAGFDQIRLKKTNPGLACLSQLIIEWFESLGRRLHPRLAKIFRVAMFLPYTILNLVAFAYRNLPWVRNGADKAEIYLDIVLVARRP